MVITTFVLPEKLRWGLILKAQSRPHCNPCLLRE